MKNQYSGFWILLFVFLPLLSIAQKELSLENAVMGRWGNLSPQRLANFSWIPETNLYTYSEKSDSIEVLIAVNAYTFEKSELVTSPALGSAMTLKKELARIPNLTWINTNEAYYIVGGIVNMYNRKTQEVKNLFTVPSGSSNLEFRPHSTDVAFTKENNLFLIIDGKEIQITNFSDPNIVAGQTVSRVEFGIEHGVIWSANGEKLAFYQKDESKVTNYPLVNYSTRPASLANTKYPMAGMESEVVSIGIYTVGKEGVTYLKTDGPIDQYLTSVSWGPKSKSVYVGHLNRDQNDFHMKKYAAKSGELETEIFNETDEQYVHPMHNLEFIGKEDFLWLSEKSGLNQFYVYNGSGQVNWHINTADILVQSFVSYHPGSKKLWFLGNHKNKIDKHLFEVVITDGGSKELKQITSGEAYFSSVSFNDDKTFAITKSSALNTPNSYDLIELKNGSISTIFNAENPLQEYQIGNTRMDTLLADDGKTILHSRTIYPFDFDTSKTYPVLVYVYNGPGVQLLHQSWLGSAPLWMYHFANKGYIVYTLDGRGSTNRGIEFEQAPFRNLGQVEMRDQLTGVKYLKSLSYVDSTKFAVHGWSYGGFMTTALLTSYPNVFKVGVAGGPVMDWRYYEIMYTERYMDTPETNKEGYDLTSNLLRASKLEDKLLIIHGTSDPTVVKQHSDLFLKECISNGVRVDYFEYPGHEHNVYGKDRVHLMDKVLLYIESNL